MYKPISLAVLTGLAAAVLFLLYPPSAERIDSEGVLPPLGQQLADNLRQSTDLDALSARTLDGINQRHTLIGELLRERVSLDQVRSEFRRLNDQNPGSWVSLRSAFRGCSDEQCLDLQIRNYLLASQPTLDQRARCERLVTELEKLRDAEGEYP